MDQRLNLITLGVRDIGRSREFYENGLGWKVSPKSQENLVLFQIGGLVLALYPQELLAEDIGIPASATAATHQASPPSFTLAYNARSKAEVDDLLAQAQQAGAHILKPAQDVFWGGYSGYFRSLDGHFFEIAWNPFWPLDDKGHVDIS